MGIEPSLIEILAVISFVLLKDFFLARISKNRRRQEILT